MTGTLDPPIDVTLGGRTYSLRPSFDALVRIEQMLGFGLGGLMQRYLQRHAGVTDNARIIYEGIRATEGNGAPDYETVGQAVVAEGFEATAPAALELLTAAFNGFQRYNEGRQEDARAAAESPGADPTTPPDHGPGEASPGATSSAPPS